MKKQIKLSRIHCAGCAENLEQKIAEVEGVNSVSIDFLTRIVTIDIPIGHAKDIIKRVEDTITSFDSSIKIIDESKYEKQEKREKIAKIIDISKIIVAIIFLFAGYFISISFVFAFPMGFLFQMIYFILNYLFI